jgi:hypothetical protein
MLSLVYFFHLFLLYLITPGSAVEATHFETKQIIKLSFITS